MGCGISVVDMYFVRSGEAGSGVIALMLEGVVLIRMSHWQMCNLIETVVGIITVW